MSKAVKQQPTKSAKSITPVKSIKRTLVNKDRAISAAIKLADAEGLSALTMRKLAGVLGVEAMSLYHHVANKEAVLDGMVDAVFSEIQLPRSGNGDWKAEILLRSASVREVLTRHPWAIGIMESRTAPGPAVLRHHDAVLGCLRGGGLSVAMTAHAYALIDSYVYGFVLQEVNLPFTDGDDLGELLDLMMPLLDADDYPHLVELTVEHIMKPGYSFGDEFEFGLNLILNGLGEAALAVKGKGSRKHA